jgi:CubicO group peptidase (beta-lactamase class C family)
VVSDLRKGRPPFEGGRPYKQQIHERDSKNSCSFILLTITSMLKQTTLLFLFFGLVISAFAQDKTAKITELMDAYDKKKEFNGSLLVYDHGKELFNNSYGYKNIAAKEFNNENSIYQIGSVTKQFTATIILKLVEKKQLKLTDKLSKFYPGYPKSDSITIHQLLSHTSGIYNYTNDEIFMTSEAVKPADEKKILALFKDKPLDFSPGTNWKYSNSGYMLLGYIIQKVTKKPYEQLVREWIFSPLQMTHSGFDFTHLKDPMKATGYFSIDENKGEVAGIVDSTVSFSAGAIYSTTYDLLKWHLGLLNNSIINRSTLELAFTPVKNKYGYGWGIDSIDGKRITKHSGGIFGFTSNFARVEADDICIIMINNVGNPKLKEITENILSILYNKPYQLPASAQTKTAIKVSEEVLKKYVGTYEVVPQFQIAITLDSGQIFAQASNQPKFELFAQKDNYFFLKAIEAAVEFVSNEKGEVEKLILHQGGRKTPAQKIK